MLKGGELMWGIEEYGRWNIQEFVARSQDMRGELRLNMQKSKPKTKQLR
jgi:hypothetical protein